MHVGHASSCIMGISSTACPVAHASWRSCRWSLELRALFIYECSNCVLQLPLSLHQRLTQCVPGMCHHPKKCKSEVLCRLNSFIFSISLKHQLLHDYRVLHCCTAYLLGSEASASACSTPPSSRTSGAPSEISLQCSFRLVFFPHIQRDLHALSRSRLLPMHFCCITCSAILVAHLLSIGSWDD